MNYLDLVNQIFAKKSFLCVGLDTDIQKIPQFLMGEEDPIFAFNKGIIDATAEFAVAFKPNLAFYEESFAYGLMSLKKTVDYIHQNYPEILVIADAKRGDIGNTSERYAKAMFSTLKADAVTVAPYMGMDSVEPFLKYNGKWVILLALTSNKGAEDFELMEDANGEMLFEKVLKTSQQWADENKMMYVVGATQAEMLADIRKIVPNHFLLVPGVGAQGGSLEKVAEYGMNDNCGLIVNSSRGIIYADTGRYYAEAAKEEAFLLQQRMLVLLEKIDR